MASENKPLAPQFPLSDEEIINIKLNQKSLTLVLDYCNDAGISPEQLIEDHKNRKELWAFNYNPMTEESADATMSIHFTKEGAEKAMETHRNYIKRTFEERQARMPHLVKDRTYDKFQYWGVDKIEVRD